MGFLIFTCPLDVWSITIRFISRCIENIRTSVTFIVLYLIHYAYMICFFLFLQSDFAYLLTSLHSLLTGYASHPS